MANTGYEQQPVRGVSDWMNIESNRVMSFQSNEWPDRISVSIYRLANAGFYFVGIADEVICFSCFIKLRDWKNGDSPKGRHKLVNPKCRFVQGMDARNIADVKYSISPHPAVTLPLHKNGSQNKCRQVGISLEGNGRITSEKDDVSNLRERRMHPNGLQYERNRLRTFKEVSLSCPVDPYDLSASGFFEPVTDISIVQCFACFVQIPYSNWKIGDRPMNTHRVISPSCPFVKGLKTGNRPLTKADRINALAYDIHQKPKFRLRVKVQHPRFSSREARISSFKSWNYAKIVQPSKLADAGFFYSNECDLVTCFYCGCRLDNWETGDIPWKEHKYWSPDCTWLKFKC